MGNFRKRADDIALVALAIGPWGIIVALAAVIGLMKCCVSKPPDVAEESINRFSDVVEHVTVTDSTHNGFRVVYATNGTVTDEQYQDICTRQSIREGFRRLKSDAPNYFNGDLLNADICDFALYTYRYHIDDEIRVHNIFALGKEKMNFYVRPNPNLENCALWMHFGTEQGNQYLNSHDINVYIPNGGRIYRYWKCRPLLQTSDTDERFSHFTESERIY